MMLCWILEVYRLWNEFGSGGMFDVVVEVGFIVWL